MREPCCRNPDSSFTCGGRICRSHHLKIVVLGLFLAHVQGRGCRRGRPTLPVAQRAMLSQCLQNV